MPRRSRFACILHAAFCIVLVLSSTPLDAQREEGTCRRPAAAPRDGAALDLTGYWVSVITEDWRYRMVTPKSGVFDSIPLNGEGPQGRHEVGSGEGRSRRRSLQGVHAANVMRLPAACTSPGATRTPCRSRPTPERRRGC